MLVAGRAQKRCHQQLRREAGCHDVRAINPIRHVARHQRQQQGGQKLVQTDETQIPRAAGQLVHLPAHGHHQHLAGGGGGETSDPEAQKGALLH